MTTSNIATTIDKIAKNNNIIAFASYTNNGIVVNFTKQQTEEGQHILLSSLLPFKNSVKTISGRNKYNKGNKYGVISLNIEVIKKHGFREVEVEVI